MSSKLRGIDPKRAEPSKPKMLIYGMSGVGKTWAAIDWPSAYYIDTEGGADLAHYTDKLKKAGAGYFGPADGSCDFRTVLEEVEALATEDHKYRTLIIDSFSKLFNQQIAETQIEMERRKIEDAFGASKKPAIQLTRRLLSWFSKLDMNVILICHQKSQWKDGKEVGVTFDGWDKLEYELHLALRIQKLGPERKAFIGKSRLAQFPEGESFPWSYADFAKKYGQAVIEGAVKKADLATREQIKEYSDLLKKVQPSDDVLSKWESACPDIAALDREAMAKRIEWLQRQSAPK